MEQRILALHRRQAYKSKKLKTCGQVTLRLLCMNLPDTRCVYLKEIWHRVSCTIVLCKLHGSVFANHIQQLCWICTLT